MQFHTEDPSSVVPAFTTTLQNRERAVQEKEAALVQAARAARKEVFAVRRARASLENELQQAQVHIDELCGQCGVLSEKLKGAMCQLEASVATAANSENEAKVTALEAELAAAREQVRSSGLLPCIARALPLECMIWN